MILKCLASSSAGNCFYLSFDLGGGRKASVLAEAGLPYGSIVRKAVENGFRLKDVSACLITHSHQDHSRGAKDVSERGIPIFATAATLEAIGVRGEALEYGKPRKLADGLFAIAFRVRHDAPDPAGFIFVTRAERAIFSIDCSEWIDDLSAYRPDYVIIEANYDDEAMSMEQLSLRRRGTEKDMAKLRVNGRIISSHMSLANSVRTVGRLDLSNCKAVFLAHLSDRMASPRAFKIRAKSLLGVECFSCLKDGGIE